MKKFLLFTMTLIMSIAMTFAQNTGSTSYKSIYYKGNQKIKDSLGVENVIIFHKDTLSYSIHEEKISDTLTIGATGIDSSTVSLYDILMVKGDNVGDTVNVTTNPQIGNGFNGQVITLYGTSGDVIKWENGNGLRIDTSYSGVFYTDRYSILTFKFIGGEWINISGRHNE
jgi:hypothetical protein